MPDIATFTAFEQPNFDHPLTTNPAVAAGAGAGGSPPAPTFATGSNDARGTVNAGTGTTPAAGVLATITFGTPFQNVPAVLITPTNDATAALTISATSVSATGFSITTHSAPGASQSVGTYQVAYAAIG